MSGSRDSEALFVTAFKNWQAALAIHAKRSDIETIMNVEQASRQFRTMATFHAVNLLEDASLVIAGAEGRTA